jgi:hypothetical protein
MLTVSLRGGVRHGQRGLAARIVVAAQSLTDSLLRFAGLAGFAFVQVDRSVTAFCGFREFCV